MEYYGNAQIINSLSDLPKIGEKHAYLSRCYCISVQMLRDYKASLDGYVIYKAVYRDGRFIDTNINTCYWTYAIKAENMNYILEVD